MQYVEVTGSGIVKSSRALFQGFALRATVAAVVNIYDGTDNTGTLVIPIDLDANQSGISHFDGMPFNNGIYVEVASGTIEGTVWVE